MTPITDLVARWKVETAAAEEAEHRADLARDDFLERSTR